MHLTQIILVCFFGFLAAVHLFVLVGLIVITAASKKAMKDIDLPDLPDIDAEVATLLRFAEWALGLAVFYSVVVGALLAGSPDQADPIGLVGGLASFAEALGNGYAIPRYTAAMNQMTAALKAAGAALDEEGAE